VTAVERLVTTVDVTDRAVDAATMSVSALHEAALADGSRVVLLEGRGWTSSLMQMRADGDVPRDAPDIWASTSLEEIEASARTVVGPDEPFGGGTREEAEAGHWAFLAGVLRRHGVVVDPQEFRRLPHDVVLSDRLLARLRR
jgi:hypothetical protein